MSDSYNKLSSGGADMIAYYYDFHEQAGSILQDVSTKTVNPVRVQDSFTGVKNPYWKQQIRLEQSAGTPASGSFLRIDVPYIDHLQRASRLAFSEHHVHSVLGCPSTDFAATIGTVSPGSGASASVISEVISRCYSDFLSKAKSAQSSFESGQDLAEWHQSVNLILHPMTGLRKHILSYLSSVKKLKFKYKKAANLKKAVADAYLEFNFGWRPLAFDISDGIAGLSKERMPSVTISSKATKHHTVATSLVNRSGSFPSYKVHTKIDSYYSVRLKGVVHTYRNGKPPSLLQEFQLLPEDFAPTAWDLIPYSFVVDYFVNIGDIIRAYSFPSSSIAWVNQSTHNDCMVTKSYSPTESSVLPPATWTSSSEFSSTGNLVALYSLWQRSQPSPSSLIPPLVIQLPLIGSKPWVNIGALLTGRTRSITPLW